MRVAITLRRWLNRAVGQLYETRTAIDSDGHGGSVHREIADFGFAEDIVPLLDAKTAIAVFDLIHQRDASDSNIRDTWEFQGDEEATDEFMGSAAHICIAGLTIFRKLARRLRWNDPGLPPRIEAMLKEEAEHYEQLKQRRAVAM